MFNSGDDSESANQNPYNSDSQVFLEVLLKGRSFPGPGNSSQPGEVLSPLAGEMRLQSDFRISQDSRTACFWQAFVSMSYIYSTG